MIDLPPNPTPIHDELDRLLQRYPDFTLYRIPDPYDAGTVKIFAEHDHALSVAAAVVHARDVREFRTLRDAERAIVQRAEECIELIWSRWEAL